MIKERDIIFFAPYMWNAKAFGSCKRFADIFSRENRVLYVNNIQFLMPKMSEIGGRSFQKRVTRKLQSLTKPFYKANPALHVFTPVLFPHYGSPLKKGLNAYLLKIQMKWAQRALGFRMPLIWIENPVGVLVAEKLHPALVLYYRIDKYESHSELRDPQEIIRLDKRLTLEADLILCVSQRLYEEKLAVRKKDVYYVPHGVDTAHFGKAQEELTLPADLREIARPIVGYFGTLDSKNDDSVIHYCATKRPDISFVLIGEKGGRNNLLEGLPNVHFLGYKEYSQLPYYGKVFDACIMFWKRSEWIEYCNPVKTMEYLAMGKPVISVPFHEISKRYDGIIATARSPEEFLSKIEEEIAHDSPQRQEARMGSVRNETWEARVEDISRLIGERISQKQKMGADQNQR